MVDPATAQRLAERFGYVILAADFGEGGGTVLAVQGEGLPGGFVAPACPGRLGVCRHDLILERRGTPRAPVRARVPLLPSGPGGVGEVTPHGGSVGKSSHPWHCSRPLGPRPRAGPTSHAAANLR